MPSSKPSGRLDDRGRPRERERRPPGTHRERSRERNLGRSGQHKSRSPNRPSKTAPPRSSAAATTGMISNLRTRDHNVDRSRMDDLSRFRNEMDPKRSLIPAGHRQRDRETTQQSKLRMDRDRNRDKEPREVEKADWHVPRKHQNELDRVVKRAREERSSYWNKRVIEAEEKDPNRWGHSGFKELYRRDMRLGGQPPGRPGSQSPPPSKHLRGSPERQLLPKRPIPEQRLHPRRTRSRSKSRTPKAKTAKSRTNRPRSLSPPPAAQRSSNFVPVGTRPSTTSGPSNSRSTPLLRSRNSHLQPESRVDRTRESRNNGSGSSLPKVTSERRSRLDTSSKLLSRRLGEGSAKSSDFASSDMAYRSSRTDRERPMHKNDSRSHRNDRSAMSDSMSRSRTRSSASSPPSKMKRTSGGPSRGAELKSKGDGKSKESWSRSTASKKDASRSRSRSSSSSSSSSEDEDVLELHADDRRKGRASSISRSSSSSSDDDDSKSNSASSRASSKRKKDSGSSSSSSSSESDSDDDSDISGKITMDKRKRPYVSDTVADKSGNKASSGKDDKQRTAAKRPSSASAAASSSKTPRTLATKSASGSKGPPPAPSSREKEKSVGGSSKGDSDSESGSTSDSSDEPRMTLSERFAKLTQMSTDKREFAKPLLAVSEIDTKLKVVKDLRNADVKIYVDGPQGMQHQKPSSSSAVIKAPPRPKSPVFSYSEGEKRYSSDERRRHFERMERDEPNERPPDWSDARVRFEYYRDRGYFNDRPLNFDEYVKWEQWWYQYRDWLQSEGYFPRMGNPAPRGGHYPGPPGEGHRGPGMRGGEWAHPPNTISSRMRPGPGPGQGMPPPPHGGGGRRVEQVPMRLAPLSSRPHFMGRSEGHHGPPGHGLGRSIDRAPGGSLIVNIRQGSSYGPRGRQVGLIRGGRTR